MFRIRGIAPAGATRSTDQPAYAVPDQTVSDQAFGTGSSGGAPSPHAALSPLTAFGQTHWTAVGVAVFLGWLYWTLPE